MLGLLTGFDGMHHVVESRRPPARLWFSRQNMTEIGAITIVKHCGIGYFEEGAGEVESKSLNLQSAEE